MFRLIFLLTALAGFLSACEEGPRVNDKGEVVRVFWIEEEDTADIQFRHLDAVNAVRAANGLCTVQLSPELNA
ncbi:MAG: CAP domain-containing protein, partial [Gammaproteobacteria bacterium]|nr:CAP domain-containing protein [Gammaproteobacteria bacterium]